MTPRSLPWLAVAAVAAVCSATFLGRSYSEWDAVYVPAAARLWAGQPLYRPSESFLYPPLTSVIALPWVFLPETVGRVAWWLINVAAVWAILRLGWSLAGGTARDGWAAWAAGLACGAAFIQNCWSHQQTDLAMAALQMTGLWLLMRDRSLGAGALFGLAAAVKATPLLWLPYLIWRGRFGAAGVMLAVALGASLLPDLVSRPPSGTWLSNYAGFVSRTTGGGHLGVWGTDPLYNQSLAGQSLRLTGVTMVPEGRGYAGRFDKSKVDPVWQRRTVQGVLVVLGLITLACAARPGPVYGSAVAWEGAIVFLLALLASPMSGPAHFGVLVFPGFLLARQGRWAFVAVAAGLAVFSARDVVGPVVYGYALMAGTVTLGALTLLVGCWHELLRLRATKSPALSAEPVRRAA